MQPFSRLPISQKLIVLLMLISSAVLLLATAGFALNDWQTTQRQARETLQAQAEIVSKNTIAALMFSDPDAAHRNLLSLQQHPDLVLAVLYDNEGTPFASYPAEPDSVPALPEHRSGLLEDNLYVVQPIQMDQELLGYTLLISDLSSLNNKQLQQLGIVVVVFFLSLIVAVLLSRRVQRVISDPISELAHAVRTITLTKRYDLRIERRSEDEIGGLAQDFNRMVEQVQHRDNELQQARQELENKVRERTAELLELTRKLEHQAYHDSLTGLPNRTTFDSSLQKAINYCSHRQEGLTVMFLDLDRFKDINDSLGHDMGDQLLIEISRRLKGCLRSSDILARLGGDEFAVLAMGTCPETASGIAGKLISTIQHPIPIDGYKLQVTTSIGISIYPTDGEDAATILKHADMAMYAAKEAGKNQFRFFAAQMNQQSERRLQLEHKLQSAIRNNLFELYYQPKWCCKTDTIIGVEALIRWQDHEEGFISPAEFIPLAEDCGLISAIDHWVINTACQQIGQLQAQPDILRFSLSVNCSPANLIQQDLYQRIEQVLTDTAFPARQLELEITETVVATENSSLLRQLQAIRDLGVSISIDDFGVAYSSLSRLKKLPITTLKIDRSFVQDIGLDQDDEVIVKTVIDMAHNLNLSVVAEGVETQQQYQFVTEHGCDQVQGFFLGKPMPLAQLASLLQQNSWPTDKLDAPSTQP